MISFGARQAEIEAVAKCLRRDVRRKAMLPLDWGKASDSIKKFYYNLAKRLIDDEEKSTA